MAINFPDSPTNAQTYNDPGTGQTWTYELATNSWTASSLATTGGIAYKGSVDITAAPPTGAKAGEQWSVGTGGTANAGFGPGVTGTITKGSMVMYTGSGWLETNHTVPDATPAVKGIDTRKWSRTGTVLSPANAGDDVNIGGTNIALKAADGNATFAGKVGIGTTTPSSLLDIEGSLPRLEITDTAGTGKTARPGIMMRDSAATGLFFIGGSSPADSDLTIKNYSSGGAVSLWTADTERARLDASGRLLVGASSTSGSALVQIQGYSGVATGAGLLDLKKGSTTPADGDALGALYFSDSGSNRGAQITGIRDGGTWTPGSSHPGRLVFSTTANGASSPTERMTIKASGVVNIAATTVYADNTAAKAGGLVAGDIYRKADGTLMITF